MQTLEMRFGNKKFILEKVVQDIYDLPTFESRKINLIEFASKLKNAVTAIKSLKNIGYLYSPELSKNVLKKIPSSMIFNYVRYAASVDHEKSDLEKLSEFLFIEAEMALTAGVLDVGPIDLTNKRNDRPSSNNNNIIQKKSVFVTVDRETNSLQQSNNISNRCAFCGRKNHSSISCREFEGVPISQRWKSVRKLGLCLNCLGSNHSRKDCKDNKAGCNQCNRKHHTLLHFTEKSNNVKPVSERKIFISNCNDKNSSSKKVSDDSNVTNL